MGKRYVAMVMTEKMKRGSYRSSPLGSSRPFAVWDDMTNDWWRGNATGIAYYKTIQAARGRARTLNEGTFVSQGKGKAKDDGESSMLLMLTVGDEEMSHWFDVQTEARVYIHRPWYGEQNLPMYENRTIDDFSFDSLMRFYLNDMDRMKWTNTHDYQPRDEYDVYEVLWTWDGGERFPVSQRRMSLLDWLVERMGIHESIRWSLDEEELQRGRRVDVSMV